jgi:hypothetical protein
MLVSYSDNGLYPEPVQSIQHFLSMHFNIMLLHFGYSLVLLTDIIFTII